MIRPNGSTVCTTSLSASYVVVVEFPIGSVTTTGRLRASKTVVVTRFIGSRTVTWLPFASYPKVVARPSGSVASVRTADPTPRRPCEREFAGRAARTHPRPESTRRAFAERDAAEYRARAIEQIVCVILLLGDRP